MDYKTRTEFERLCALAELEENSEKFGMIKLGIIQLLEKKEADLKAETRNKSFRTFGPRPR